ncbi:hypothetical protein V6N11_058365 [Hibiscus sabdariffa]|uniref:RNase H type-1 domain-containing protein n=1 Tax=Hibiscus sabdariffa TaxID=183260 RepID=A0ABR2U4B8_9ROSI
MFVDIWLLIVVVCFVVLLIRTSTIFFGFVQGRLCFGREWLSTRSLLSLFIFRLRTGFTWIFQISGAFLFVTLIETFFGCLLWNLWRRQNEFIFEGLSQSNESVLPASLSLQRECIKVLQDGQWDWSSFTHLINSEAALHIAMIKPPLLHHGSDTLGWVPSLDLRFQLCSAYVIRKGFHYDPLEPIWRSIAQFRGLFGHFFGMTLLWKSVVKHEKFIEFVRLPFKDWIHMNISNLESFAICDSNRDIFGMQARQPRGAWSRPQVGWWKLNSDEACCRRSRVVACGLIAAWSMQISRLIVKSGCLEAVQAISRFKSGATAAGSASHIVNLLAQEWEAKVEHVHGEMNMIANSMARRASFMNLVYRRYLDLPMDVKDDYLLKYDG